MRIVVTAIALSLGLLCSGCATSLEIAELEAQRPVLVKLQTRDRVIVFADEMRVTIVSKDGEVLAADVPYEEWHEGQLPIWAGM